MSAQSTIKETFCSVVETMQEVQQKSRTTPIEDSFYTVPDYPVRIYLIPASKHYQACKVGRMNGTRPRTSLKTENRATAIRAAKEWYNGLLLKQANGEPLVDSPDFKKAAEELFKEDEARTKLDKTTKSHLSKSTHNNNLSVYDSSLLEYFGKMQCKNIKKSTILEFVEWVRTKNEKKTLTDKTINNQLMVLSKVLRKALELEYISALPPIPDLSPKKAASRGWLTDEEFGKLCITIDAMVVEGTQVHGAGQVTDELKLITLFAFNTFLRSSGDMKLLQHKHIQVKQAPETGESYLLIYATAKSDPRYTVSLPAAVGIYNRLRQLHVGKTGPDDHVFYPGYARATASSKMAKQFRMALERANLRIDIKDQKRDLYSSRHTVIMNALRIGMDINWIAENSGNSVEIIEDHYGSHYRAEMGIDRFVAAINKKSAAEVGSTLEDLLAEA